MLGRYQEQGEISVSKEAPKRNQGLLTNAPGPVSSKNKASASSQGNPIYGIKTTAPEDGRSG